MMLIIKSTLLLCFAQIVIWFIKSATIRHWIWTWTMIGLLLLPIYPLLVPTITLHTIEIQEGEKLIKEIIPFPATQKQAPLVDINTKESITNKIDNEIIQPISTTEVSASSYPIASIFMIIWGLGFTLLILNWLRGLYQVHLITTQSSPFKLEKHQTIIHSTFQKTKFKQLSSDIWTPITKLDSLSN